MRYIKWIALATTFVMFGAVSYSNDTRLSNTSGCSCTSEIGYSIATDNKRRVHVAWIEVPIEEVHTLANDWPITAPLYRLGGQTLNLSLSPIRLRGLLNIGNLKLYTQAETTMIYYRRSLDNGRNWEDSMRLIVVDGYPVLAIATDGEDVVHLVWSDCRDADNEEVYYKQSIDGGANWSEDTRLTDTELPSEDPIISVANNIVHLVWREDFDSLHEFHYRRSADNGRNWDPARKLIETAPIFVGDTVPPIHSLAASENTVHIAWNDGKDDTTGEIYYKRSTDGGSTWRHDIRLTNDREISLWPSIACYGNLVGVVWVHLDYDPINPKSFVYFQRSNSGGNTWEEKVIISDTTKLAAYGFGNPKIAINNGLIGVVWGAFESKEDSIPRIYFKSSDDGGLTWSEEHPLSPERVSAFFPSISLDCFGNAHIVWCDDREDNFEVYYTQRQVSGVSEKPAEGWIRVLDMLSNPNPFRTITRLVYAVPKSSLVSLKIYGSDGRLVRTLASEYKDAGTYTVFWDGKDNVGRQVECGVYLCHLIVSGVAQSTKVVFMK